MSELAERIRVAAERITAMSPSRERRAEASDLGYVVINNAPTILAGLAALEANASPLDKAAVDKARKKLALELATDLEDKWPNITMEGYDTDEAAQLIEQWLPLTYAEADAQVAALKESLDEPRKPSRVDALKAALGMESGSIGETLDRAVAALEEREKLRQDLAVIRDSLVVTGGVSFADQSRIERCHTIAKQALQSKDAKP